MRPVSGRVRTGGCTGPGASCGCAKWPYSARFTPALSGVLPAVPIRQGALSFPWSRRLVFATHPQILTRVLGKVSSRDRDMDRAPRRMRRLLETDRA